MQDQTQNTESTRQQIQAFGDAYQYDTSYLQEMLQFSPGAFGAYAPAQGLSHFRDQLPLDAHFVARIVTMMVEDCGPCAQLNLRMAVEAGVSRALLQTLLDAPESLPTHLADVRAQTRFIVGAEPEDEARTERLLERYGAAGIAEMATAIAGSQIFPTLKRALGHAKACEMLTLDF